MTEKDANNCPFAILGLDPTEDWPVIRQAYRHKIQQVHPDIAGADVHLSDAQKLNEAYQSLKNPEARHVIFLKATQGGLYSHQTIPTEAQLQERYDTLLRLQQPPLGIFFEILGISLLLGRMQNGRDRIQAARQTSREIPHIISYNGLALSEDFPGDMISRFKDTWDNVREAIDFYFEKDSPYGFILRNQLANAQRNETRLFLSQALPQIILERLGADIKIKKGEDRYIRHHDRVLRAIDRCASTYASFYDTCPDVGSDDIPALLMHFSQGNGPAKPALYDKPAFLKALQDMRVNFIEQSQKDIARQLSIKMSALEESYGRKVMHHHPFNQTVRRTMPSSSDARAWQATELTYSLRILDTMKDEYIPYLSEEDQEIYTRKFDDQRERLESKYGASIISLSPPKKQRAGHLEHIHRYHRI